VWKNFPETRLSVLGFGRDKQGKFKIIAEQSYIDGRPVSDEEIADYIYRLRHTYQHSRIATGRNKAIDN